MRWRSTSCAIVSTGSCAAKPAISGDLVDLRGYSPRVRSALLILTLAACRPPPTAMTTWPKLDDKFLADAAATFNWKLGMPIPLAITRDGAVLFRRTPPRDFASDLYELSP